MREVNDAVLDRALYLWFSQRRSKGDLISGTLLCEKSLEVNEKLGGAADFKGQNEGHLGCHYQLLLDSRKAASSVSCLLDIKLARRERDIKAISVHGVRKFPCILDRLRSDKSEK
ncbi:hypothetical protein TNCV_4776011 [Trichonephila clavipes]|nr:hypothetical protein TNCV_4776011 [Trichonephila clavipes]